nr:hypothetical protein [Planctomycetota bacterium]
MRFLFRALILVAICSGAASAATVNWTGPATGNWSVASNWTPSGIPNFSNDVVIPAGVTTTVDLSIPINSLTSAGNVIITGQGTLFTSSVTMTGQLTLSGGTLASATLNTGTGGSYVCTGTNSTISGVTIATGTILDLSQINGTQLTVINSLTINGTMKVGSADGTRFAILSAADTQTWSGSGSILFGNTLSNQITLVATNMTLTTGVTIHGQSGQFNASNTGTTLA